MILRDMLNHAYNVHVTLFYLMNAKGLVLPAITTLKNEKKITKRQRKKNLSITLNMLKICLH